MATEPVYVQCLLRKQSAEHTAWIPKQLAVEGKVLELRSRWAAKKVPFMEEGCVKESDAVTPWDPGWQVKEAYKGVELKEGALKLHQEDYREYQYKLGY